MAGRDGDAGGHFWSVADLPGLVAGAGPIVVAFGLCWRCHQAAGLDRAG
jgi:hypothetical protein